MSARPTPALSVPACAGAASTSVPSSAATAVLTAPDRRVGSSLMRRIVDGMNVIGTRPDGWWRDRPAAQRRLVAELGALREDVTVVFDGAPVDIDAPAHVEVAFAARRGPDAADDAIVDRVRDAPDATQLRVATSDRALA